jgi:hypothetical protein
MPSVMRVTISGRSPLDQVHDNKPSLSGGTGGDAKGTAAYIEMNPLHMLCTIWRVLVPEGDGNVIEEITGLADRSTWLADDADKVESKDGVVFIFFACRP